MCDIEKQLEDIGAFKGSCPLEGICTETNPEKCLLVKNISSVDWNSYQRSWVDGEDPLAA